MNPREEPWSYLSRFLEIFLLILTCISADLQETRKKGGGFHKGGDGDTELVESVFTWPKNGLESC